MLDAERQIRFLYPPVFFVASLFPGVRLDDQIKIQGVFKTLIVQSSKDLGIVDWGTPVVALVTAGGLVATIAMGFLISSVTVLALRSASIGLTAVKWCRSGSYEAVLLPNAKDIRKRLEIPTTSIPQNADALFLSATLDHELIPRPIHDWLFRRWNMFYLYAHSATALLLALGVGAVLGIVSLWWTILTAVVVGGFIRLAWWSWTDSMGMLLFQAQRPLPVKQRPLKEEE